jgi:hypothetical protein
MRSRIKSSADEPLKAMVAVPRGESSGDRDDRDYLDHVALPIEGWSEYYSILVPGGYCAFTVPTIDCTARSRADLPQRYRGNQRSPDSSVQTDYGWDAWKHL